MSVIETLTFRLAEDADEASFLEADRLVQTEFIPNLPGFIRRTTARGSDGDWIVVTLWGTTANAEEAMALAEQHPMMLRFMAMLDGPSVALGRYTTLD